MRYGYLGSMRAKPGHRGEVVALLVAGAAGLEQHGCSAYAVSEAEDDWIVVFEIWNSKQHHDDSLKLAETQAAIAKARPLLTDEFSGRELNVVGGLGLR